MGVTLCVRNLGKQYGKGVLALRDVSFDVDADAFVSVLGPSGCGKSTLLRLIAGLVQATQGRVEIDGQTVGGPITGASMVFQRPVLLEWRTVLDNVLFAVDICGKPVRQYRQRALELLQLAGLVGFEHAFPYQLSGGMQQRVALCRALLTAPRLILMDEPFGALDVMTREHLGLELLRIRAGSGPCTIVFVTHSINEAVLLSDKVLIMTARPGTLHDIVDIDLPRPRTVDTLASARFVELSARIRKVMAA